MIVTCSACLTRFNVDANVLGDTGREVRCTKCRKTWHQMPTNETITSFIHSGEDEDSSATESQFQQKSEDDEAEKRSIENLQNSVIDKSSFAVMQSKKGNFPNEKTEGAPRAVEGGGSWAGWLIFIVVLCGLGGGGYFYHVKIVEFWPPVGPLFEMIGLGSQKSGLAIQNVNWAYKKEEDKTVLVVAGEVINDSESSQLVPRLLVILLDERNRRLRGWTTTTIKNYLDSGHVTNFSTRLINPPDGAKSIAVTLEIQK